MTKCSKCGFDNAQIDICSQCNASLRPGDVMEDIASNSIEINRSMRVDLHEILAMAEGLGKLDRDRLVPKIKAALARSANMPTVYDVIAAKGGIGK